jgi:hypothetical protein
MELVERLSDKALTMGGVCRSMAIDVTRSAIKYVRKRGLRRIGQDLTKSVSRNPVQAMVALTAFGFLAGVLVRRR